MNPRDVLSTILFLLMVADAAASQEAKPSDAPKPFTIFLAGDSTMATQAVVPATPARGWGQML